MHYYNGHKKRVRKRKQVRSEIEKTDEMRVKKMRARWIKVLSLSLVLVFLLAVMTPVMAASKKSESTKTTPKLVAFTFDDGPGDYTEMLLEGLEERNAVATFFMTGENGKWGVKNYYDVLDRMIEDNCQLGNHTYGHKKFSTLQKGELKVQLDGVENYLYKAMGGTYNEMVRIPGGENSGNVAEVDHPIITWNVDSLDWDNRNTMAAYQRIMDTVSDGSIILMHDLYPSSVQAALHAMDKLAEEGYEFVTVSELFRRKGIKLENGTIYSDARSGEKNLPAYSAPELNAEEKDDDSFSVSVKDPEKKLTYYYTLDGSTPRMSSEKLTKSVTIKAGQVLKVAGYDEYAVRTPVQEQTYKTQEERETEQLIAEKEEKANKSFFVRLFRKLHIFGF